ncbi:inositol monophosphatase family protein [Streptomyces sp. NPDC057702]|uniref:inositol monophosphatase family protein n=1 Tax=unclassified Streptomyces TaxID=2593676 RepID=UPI0036C20B70
MLITNTETDARLAVRAARAGAAVVRALYGGPLERYDKGAGDFATAADLAAERAILDVLRAARPDDAVTGEESGRTGAEHARRQWWVDPLCGTLNYAVRTPLVAVNVALRDGDEVTAAAVADPLTGEVFWTEGKRAWSRGDADAGAGGGAGAAVGTGLGDGAGLGDGGDGGDADGDTELVPSAASGLVDLNLDPPFPNAPRFRAAHLLTDPAFGERFRPRVVSTSLAVAWVAAGRRAAYVTDGHLRDSVHFTAGIALCQAAGCVVTDLDGRPPHTGAGGLIVAADEPTHAILRDLVRRQGQPPTTER